MKKLVTYSGRFQPFGPHHYSAYRYLCDKFAEEGGFIWITSSNKIEYPDSPFSFIEKQQIITSMFDISAMRVVQVKNPYDPVEIIPEKRENVTFITALSKKDADRLEHSKYFEMYYDGMRLKSMDEKGYIIIVPEFKHNDKEISGTILRDGFAFKRFKRKLFKEIYGEYNEKIFKLIIQRLSFMKLMEEEYRNGYSTAEFDNLWYSEVDFDV